MTTSHPDRAPSARPSSEIRSLHHVGHVVTDARSALATFRRMGFRVPPFALPAFACGPDAPPAPVGVGNTHIAFERNFVELVAVVDHNGELGDTNVTVVPLDAPPEVLPILARRISATVARLTSALARFEGVHILVFETVDVDLAASRLGVAGVTHSGVQRVRRPGGTGASPVPIGFLEIDDAPGLSPEGAIGPRRTACA